MIDKDWFINKFRKVDVKLDIYRDAEDKELVA